ncbi:MAG TPA: hypothetical protein DDW17_01030 [Deltaproteobacteria bacterium]|nr:hypothetical protein [Deltaproteobacteria bacterium]
MKKKTWFLCSMLTIAFLFTVTISGCFPRGKPPYLVEQYILDYPSPVLNNYEPTYETITVVRFTVAQSVNSMAIVYKPDVYRMATYQNYRWRSNPGDMVADFLIRDLRNAGLFTGVFSYRDGESTRFVLEGGLEEFYEKDKEGSGNATITLYIVLLDQYEQEITNRIVLQKRYHIEEPLDEQSPKGLAQGMSSAMAKVSKQVIQDIYDAIQTR